MTTWDILARGIIADWHQRVSWANRAVNAGAELLAVATVPALLRGCILILQTIKHLLGWNSRAALDPSLNRVFEFR